MSWLLFSVRPHAPVALECPSVFHDGKNIITCILDTAVAAKAPGCQTIGGNLSFELRQHHPQTLASTVCTVDLGSCDTAYNEDGCKCLSHTSDVKRYQLKFIGSSFSENGSSLHCLVPCRPGGSLQVFSAPSCQRLFSKSVCLLVSLYGCLTGGFTLVPYPKISES